jgi:hypothetical protein
MSGKWMFREAFFNTDLPYGFNRADTRMNTFLICVSNFLAKKWNVEVLE